MPLCLSSSPQNCRSLVMKFAITSSSAAVRFRWRCGAWDAASGAYDVHDAREIFDEHVQRHLGGQTSQRFHQQPLLSTGAIVDGQHLDLLDPRRCAKLDDIASQLTWPRSRSASSMPTIVTVISVPRSLA